MIDIDKFMNEIYAPLVSHSNVSQLVKVNQKIPPKQLNDNRVVYNMILFSNTDPKHTIITNKNIIPSDDPDFEKDIEIENIFFPEATLSITGYNDTLDEINKIREWFYVNGLGNFWLEDNDWDCVIREVMEIENRTTYLESDYEKRFGFDVRLEFKDVVKVAFETIEKVEITNKDTGITKEVNL